MLEQLQSDYATLELRVAALESQSDWFDLAKQNQYHVASCSYRSQSEIDSKTVKVTKNPSGSNENVIYDVAKNAASIVVAGSLALQNRVNLNLPRIRTGEVLFQWEYMPSGNWLGNGTIVTHKMFMIGITSRSDNRLLEQRFWYEAANRPRWRCDTRDYGAASGLEGLAVANPSFVEPDKWIKFESLVNLVPTIPEYSVDIIQDGNRIKMYDRFPLDTFHSNNCSIDFFSPTWVNTSQATTNPPRIHGWLRNAVALWNPTGLLS